MARSPILAVVALGIAARLAAAAESPLVAKPDAFQTLVNPNCSHCKDEAKRRAGELKADDPVLAWIRGYSDGGAIPFRFFLAPYRVISDSYGVFVYDPDAGFARGFAPSFDFRFHGWRGGVMVMRHKDGTLFSCLSGVAFDGPRKGERLKPVPTVVGRWGWWLNHYPDAVAYHMFDKYKPVELPTELNPNSAKSRGKTDPRLPAGEPVLGVWTGKSARAYPIAALEKSGFVRDEIDGEPVVILWEPTTRTAAAYRPVASQPRKFKGPEPNVSGVSPPDEGTPIPLGTPAIPPKKVPLSPASNQAAGRYEDAETKSQWDVTGRCVAGWRKGWTLEWIDSVQVKWFAWTAEHPSTSIHTPTKDSAAKPTDVKKKVQMIAGTAEFLRLLPKPFATIKAIDLAGRTVTLQLDGEAEAKSWPLEPDAEIKVAGWWGRLEQFKAGDRAWVWMKLNRQKKPVSIVMLADVASEYDMHGQFKPDSTDKPKLVLADLDVRRAVQQAWLRRRWTDEGLPGTVTFHHVFSGELEIMLDHEAMRWGRSLIAGDSVRLGTKPPIAAVVKSVAPWRERTLVRLVVGELQSSELKIGDRVALKTTPPSAAVQTSDHPPDLDRPRSKAERVEWFLASTYCTCSVGKDTCTGHFYTLASCNPNGCGLPNSRRDEIAALIDKGRTDRQIFDELLKDDGPLLVRPHLQP
jgi:hypothetical protein